MYYMRVDDVVTGEDINPMKRDYILDDSTRLSFVYENVLILSKLS